MRERPQPAAPTSGGGLLSLRLPFDPLLLAATIGLLICSIITLKSATADDIAGAPHYFVNRQAIFAAIGGVIGLIIGFVADRRRTV